MLQKLLTQFLDFFFRFTLYSVCSKQGRQKEPTVKTFRSPLSAEFWRIACCSQPRSFPRHQIEEMKIFNISHNFNLILEEGQVKSMRTPRRAYMKRFMTVDEAKEVFSLTTPQGIKREVK